MRFLKKNVKIRTHLNNMTDNPNKVARRESRIVAIETLFAYLERNEKIISKKHLTIFFTKYLKNHKTNSQKKFCK